MPLTTHFLLSKTFRTASDRLGVAKLPYRTHSHQRYPTPESCHIAITSPSSAHRFLPRFPHPTPSHPISPRAISLSLFKFRHYLAQDDNEAHFHLTNIDRPRVPASRAVSVRHARIGGNVAHLRFSPSPHLYFGLGILTSLYDQNSPLEQLHTPSFCTSFDAENSSMVRREVAVGDAKPPPHVSLSRASTAAITTTSTVTADRDNDISTITSTRRPLRLLRRGDHNDHGEATTVTTMATGYDYDHADKWVTTTATGDHEEMVRPRENDSGNHPEATDDYGNGGAMATAEDAEAAEASSAAAAEATTTQRDSDEALQ
ncbi:hypothetical protein EDB85DRAFT_2292495 [Lactarius pseudohatsudake]|nr:hypothetical protein EDB85DRAFT_2292495 [Lactarius pseudohatsudake]